MHKLYNDDNFLYYKQHKSTVSNAPTIIFLHGLMSGMKSTKSNYIENYCQYKDYNFITFDNFGHGESSGPFLDQTIGSWLLGVEIILKNLTTQPVIIVGSSLGGWLALLAALKWPEKVQSVIGVAAAPDFTESLIWQKLLPEHQKQMQEKGFLLIDGRECQSTGNPYSYPISHKLITEARNHLLLNKEELNINCPIHLIHGLKDLEVPSEVSSHILPQKLQSTNIVIKLIKDGLHGLSRQQDLTIITNSIEETL